MTRLLHRAGAELQSRLARMHYSAANPTGAAMRHLSVALAALLTLAAPALAQKPGPATVVVAFGADAETHEPADITSRDTQNIADHLWGSPYEIDDNGK